MVSDSQKVTEAVGCNVCDRWKKAFCQVSKSLEEKHDRRASSVLKGQSQGRASAREAPRPGRAPRSGCRGKASTQRVQVKGTICSQVTWRVPFAKDVRRREAESREVPGPYSLWHREAGRCSCFGDKQTESNSEAVGDLGQVIYPV